MTDLLHKGTDGAEVFDLASRRLSSGDEFTVGVSRATQELNDLRAAVQGLYGALLDYSGIQLPNEQRRHKLPGRRSLKHKSADLDKLTSNTFDLMKSHAYEARKICDSYSEDDLVCIQGRDMLRELCNMLAKCGQAKHAGVLLAHRWWYCDGVLRNNRTLHLRADGVQKWKMALIECEGLLEA